MLRHFYKALYLTKREKKGYALLVLIFILVLIGSEFVLPRLKKKSIEFSIEEIENFKQISEKAKKELSPQIAFFKFNPNKVTKSQLDSMGFPVRASENLIKYRQSGGAFKSNSDFRKVYGLNDSIFNIYKKFLIFDDSEPKSKNQIFSENKTNITEQKEAVYKERNIITSPNFNLNFSQVNYDSLVLFGFSSFVAQNVTKYCQSGGVISSISDLKSIYGIDTNFVNKNAKKFIFPKKILDFQFEINTANQDDLEKIPGIGKAYASRILKYRELLHGFCDYSQLNEVHGLNDFDFSPYKNQIKVDTNKILLINLDTVSFKTLLRHPYFEYIDVKIIFDLKNENPKISLNEIIEDPLLNPKHKSKFKFYLYKP